MGNKTQKLSNVVDQIVEWQAVVTADGSTGLTAVAGRGYFIDTTSGAIIVTTHASPKQGDKIAIVDYAGTFATNNVTINFNGANVFGASNTATLETNFQVVDLIFIDNTQGWRTVNQDTTSDIQTVAFVSATGGTITTSGDFKIHSFTGDGCFVVSCAGNPEGSNIVDYLVVAGGAAGGGADDGAGGGGAGGYRESSGNSGPYTASPLATPVGITLTAQTYPITVGAGGAANPGSSYNAPQGFGSNSIFSTITSTGGGDGGLGNIPGPSNPTSTNAIGRPGGSGGGAGSVFGVPAPTASGTIGAGNTPPVSPSQGNPGGRGGSDNATYRVGGGGGGASAAGENRDNPAITGGAGGPGATTSISGSPTVYAGGGGGGGHPCGGRSGGPGGSGGGGNGAYPSAATPGSTNTGGGGGGTAFYTSPMVGTFSGAGGSGIVIIRYKFQ
jgi:hypothetical protein